jgi:hypothetical protein
VNDKFLNLQGESKIDHTVESMPAGSYYHSFAPHGKLNEGIPLVSVQDARLIQLFNGTPDDAFHHLISHYLFPGFYSRYA